MRRLAGRRARRQVRPGPADSSSDGRPGPVERRRRGGEVGIRRQMGGSKGLTGRSGGRLAAWSEVSLSWSASGPDPGDGRRAASRRPNRSCPPPTPCTSARWVRASSARVLQSGQRHDGEVTLSSYRAGTIRFPEDRGSFWASCADHGSILPDRALSQLSQRPSPVRRVGMGLRA